MSKKHDPSKFRTLEEIQALFESWPMSVFYRMQSVFTLGRPGQPPDEYVLHPESQALWRVQSGSEDLRLHLCLPPGPTGPLPEAGLIQEAAMFWAGEFYPRPTTTTDFWEPPVQVIHEGAPLNEWFVAWSEERKQTFMVHAWPFSAHELK